MAATILCADDDRHYCQILSRAFEREGYRVETAHDGESALAKIAELRPGLVTLDVMLPRLDGFEVLEAVRREGSEHRDTPVILVSGCTISADYQARADALTANAVLQKPVPLNELLGVVADQLSRGTAARVRAARGSEALEGSLEELPFGPLLHQLHGLRASGVLEVKLAKKKKQVQLREGVPIAVRSNLVNETLGNLLLASGKITEDVLHESLVRVKRGEGLHGQILKAMHMLDEGDLAAALHHQAEEKILDIFSWSKGTYRFHRDARLKSANALSLKRSAANVILDGIRQRASIEPIDRFLGENAERAPRPGESPFYTFQDVDLGESAQEWLTSLDGTRCLADVLPLPEAARRELYALIVLELLELRAVQAPKSARPAAKAAPKRAPLGRIKLRRIKEVSRSVQSAEDRATAGERAEDDVRGELAEMARRFRDGDHFEVLGIDRAASDEDVRSAYAELAKRTHPDRFIGSSEAVLHLAEDVFGMLSAAYEEIAEKDRRMAYLRRQEGRDAEQKELEEGQRALQAELDFQKGEQALRNGQVDAALKHLRSAVDTYPDEGEYHAYHGWAWYLANPEEPGRVKKAIALVQHGRKLAPDRSKPYLFLGRLCQTDGRDELAEKMFGRAVQLDPDCVEAVRELRLLNMRRSKSRSLVGKILRRA